MARRLLILLLFLSFSRPVYAQELYFGTYAPRVPPRASFEVGVFIETKNYVMNAVEGTVSVPAELTLKGIRDGGSIVTFWVTSPHSGPGGVSFSGIIPGGYTGSRGYLFSLILEARAEGSVILTARDIVLYLHDGRGTTVKANTAPLGLTVGEGMVLIPPPDLESPEPFTPVVTRDVSIFEGAWFVSFATQDKASGLARFELREEPAPYSLRRLGRESAWQTVESPVRLSDQTLRSVIRVRAHDRSGHMREAYVLPQIPLPWYENIFTYVMIGIGVFVIFTLAKQ